MENLEAAHQIAQLQHRRLELQRQQELAYDTVQMFRCGYFALGADQLLLVGALYYRISQLVDAQNICLSDGDGDGEPDSKTTEILQQYAATCLALGISAPI